MKPLPNEITTDVIKRVGMPDIFRTLLGSEVILELASKPSEFDIKEALRRWRERGTTQESARMTQLRGKHRQGAWTGDDDGPAAA